MATGSAPGPALAFRVGDRRLTLPAAEVAEVLRVPALTRVPNAPAALAGLANVRGGVVPVVSLHVALGCEASDAARSRLVLVDGGEPVAVLVDEVLRLVSDGDSPADGAMRPLDLRALLAEAFAGLDSSGRRARRAAADAAATASGNADARITLLGFGVGEQEFALPLDSVVSVMALPEQVSAVPRTDSAMLGMVPWRERLLPLVSLAALLDLPASAAEHRRVVVARIGGASVGLVVDTISAILRVAPEGIDPVPDVLTRGNAEAEIAGVCRLDGGRRLVSILATDRLLRDGLAERLVEEEARVNQADEFRQSAGTEGDQFLIFRLGEEHFGLPIDRVEEVVRAPDQLTRLPKAPPFVEGVMNLRGRVLPVIDQRLRFEAGAGEDARSRVIVVRIGDSEAGFRVDAVTEVLRVHPGQLVDTPELAADAGAVIDRVAALDDRMVLLIDPQELLDRAERDMLAAMDGAANESAGTS